MSPIHLFNLASMHNRWLSARQVATASNIANANTPGYKAQDVTPFETALNSVKLSVTATHAAHLQASEGPGGKVEVQAQDPWEVTHTGNNVTLEQELIKAGDINRAYRLNTSVLKTFHRMMLSSTKA